VVRDDRPASTLALNHRRGRVRPAGRRRRGSQT
jgi:hypothetical protein